MAETKKLVEITAHSLNIKGIKGLVIFSRFNAHKSDSVMKGMVLAEDLLNTEGGVLYSAGTVLDHDAIKRLIRTAELNPEIAYTYALQKNEGLSASLKKLIYDDFNRLTQSLLGTKTFHLAFQPFAAQLTPLLDSIFASEQLLYMFYEQKLGLELARTKRGLEFYRHSLYVMLLASAMARTAGFKAWHWSDAQLKDLALTAMLHNIACLQHIDDMEGKDEEQQKAAYHSLLKQSSAHISLLGPSRLMVEGLQKYTVYFDDITDFLHGDSDSDRLANLLLVTDLFCTRIFGLFGARIAPRNAVDELNVMSAEGKMNTHIVEQFTLGLNFRDIFDFYREIKRLSSECPFGLHAWPYPLTGFKSPVVFVCKISKMDCDHFMSSVKAITVVKETGGLTPGEYGRCKLTTPQLLQFYEKHYHEIKEDVITKSAEVSETASIRKSLDFDFKKKSGAPGTAKSDEDSADTAEAATATPTPTKAVKAAEKPAK